MTAEPRLDRVALDASALLSGYRSRLVAAAALRYYAGFWSPWIVGEFVRKRTEWIADRALRDGCNRAELRRRLRASRQRVNALLQELSTVLHLVNHAGVVGADLSWLVDRDDWPIMQTAIAATADVLVTENTRDFPVGHSRNGVLLLTGDALLARLYSRHADAEAEIAEFLAGAG